MKELTVWHVVIANTLVLLVYLIVRKWSPKFGWGIVGLMLVLLPGAFAYLSGKGSLVYALAPAIGALVVAADLSGKLPRLGKTSS